MRSEKTRFWLLLSLALLSLSACKDDKIRIKFAGAWEIEKITITSYVDGSPSVDSVYTDCGTWAFVDNGLSDGLFNKSYLSMNQDIQCEFRWALVPFNNKLAGNIAWGPDSEGDERILIEHPGNKDGKSYNIEKISRNKFVFISFTQNSQNADKIEQMQRFELKRTNH
ncbi:MAG TPA: hypothetical protein DIW47_12785 [Bacteroidetes bacterium]|nr:hypothetical protein [Bacteroidota bacterium]